MTHGSINGSDALKFSCNYYFYEVGRIMGISTLNRYAKMLGLGEKTGIEIGGEEKGNLAGPESRHLPETRDPYCPQSGPAENTANTNTHRDV